MTRVSIAEAELYPCFALEVASDDPELSPLVTELNEAELADFKRVAEEFAAWQRRLGRLAGWKLLDDENWQLYERNLFRPDGSPAE